MYILSYIKTLQCQIYCMHRLVHVWKDISTRNYTLLQPSNYKSSKKISLKCSAYFNLQVQVLTENVDLQTGGEGAKMWGWRIRMIAPIHGRSRDKGFQVLSADISFSFSIAFLRFKDRFIRRRRLCKEWENEWFLTSPWIAC